MNGPVASREAQRHDQTGNHHRSLGAIVVEIKEELKSFFNTRIEMIRSELAETRAAAKTALPLIVLSLGLMSVGFVLLSLAVVVLVSLAFAGGPHAWFLGFAIVGILWMGFGAIAGMFAYNAFRERFPKRTIEVLKADKMWLQSEVRRQQ